MFGLHLTDMGATEDLNGGEIANAVFSDISLGQCRE